MAAIAIWRWVLLSLLASPTLGIIWLLLAAIPAFHMLAFVSSAGSAADVCSEWSFPAALVGVSSGLVTLSRGRSFLARFDDRTRFVGELGALVLASLHLQVPVLAGACFAGIGLRDLGPVLPVILTTDLHLAGIALLLLMPSLSSTLCVSLFLAAAWLIPALCSGSAALARASVWLDAAAPLRAGADGLPLSLAPAAMLVLAAYLLRSRPSPSPAG
jgi:hypothetical protein